MRRVGGLSAKGMGRLQLLSIAVILLSSEVVQTQDDDTDPSCEEGFNCVPINQCRGSAILSVRGQITQCHASARKRHICCPDMSRPRPPPTTPSTTTKATTRMQPPMQRPPIPYLDQTCMECICLATSSCNTKQKCLYQGDIYFCGPYAVSWAYWYDGGKPGDEGNPKDFEKCLTNKTCAEEAVRGYMRMYGQDCDESGAVDCLDFARIHYLGFSACGGDAIYKSDYWGRFKTCYKI